MHEVLVNRLGALSLSRKSVVRLTDRPYMTLDVSVDVKQQYNNNNYLLLGGQRGVGDDKFCANFAKHHNISYYLLPLFFQLVVSFIPTRTETDKLMRTRTMLPQMFVYQAVYFGLCKMLRARRNEKEFKVKPATSFKYFQYLLTENLKQSSRQKNII